MSKLGQTMIAGAQDGVRLAQSRTPYHASGLEMFVIDSATGHIVCETTKPENCRLIVEALNEHHAKRLGTPVNPKTC